MTNSKNPFETGVAPMLENEAFLSAILDDPEDDGVRLVYADWLQEHHQPDRAEFIRLQIELARISRTDPRRERWKHREKELLDRYAWEWAVPFGESVEEWAFHRGFIEKIQTYLQHPAEAIRERLRLAPIREIREVGFGYYLGGDNFYELDNLIAVLPDLSRLIGLELWSIYYTSDEQVKALLSSPYLAQLRTLILAFDHDSSHPIADEVLVEGLASPYRANLRYLGVNINPAPIGPSERVIRAMIHSPYLSRVRKLKLRNTWLSTELLVGLFRSMPRLDRIDLSCCRASEEVWNLLLERAQVGQLHWLCLGSAYMTSSVRERAVRLYRIPRYRHGFREAGVQVTWSSEFISPHNNGSWKGYSWEGRRQQHLFAMNRYVRSGDYDGLEAEYREDCREYVGDEVTEEAALLPFQQYEESLHLGMQWAITGAESQGVGAIFLRLLYDRNRPWASEFHLVQNSPSDSTEPHTDFGHDEPLAGFQVPEFPAAWDLLLKRGSRNNPLDPKALEHYLWARTLAAFGRCFRQYRCSVPVFFSCTRAAFRMPDSIDLVAD